MKILFSWNDCSIFDGKNASYIEIARTEIDDYVLSLLNDSEKVKLNDGYFEYVNVWAKSNTKLAKENSAYLLISNDLSECMVQDPSFPYGGMWNAYNPLKKINRKIKNIKDLQGIDII